MNVLDELRNLDINDTGRWPLAFRITFITLIFLAAAGLGYYLMVKDKIPTLEQYQAEEDQLWQTFVNKQRKAANLEAYKQQLTEIERSFGAMLRQLPGETEIPSLLVDISQTGLSAGLEEELFQPQAEIRKDFYAEKPINIQLTGRYHQMGEFVSGVAALPRIVTLHDMSIKPRDEKDGSPDDLVLTVMAKTYRYIDEEEEVVEQ